MQRYDVIVIGGGHAGSEAAGAAARRGARTLLVTSFLARVGQMSCNPAIGGVAKGTVVREVDALGGLMGQATDRTTLHFKMLNSSRGPAVRAPRAQCDRGLYPRAVREGLEAVENLDLYQATVASLTTDGGRVTGVACADGSRFAARAVILTAGTFLRGSIRMGREGRMAAGRAGDAPSVDLAHQLLDLGLEARRFKTGTPPRIDGRTVDYAQFRRQDGESFGRRFSHWGGPRPLPTLPCWIGQATGPVQDLVRANLDESALYGGAVAARGPRYCPSIEDKVVKFPDARAHQVFLEPEGLDTRELYVNGLSTSLPPDVQREMLRRVAGLEAVRMTQPGYAIEYDYFPPEQLRSSLELESLPGLFLAGQINGTTGYEEAAGQGIVAGINAAAASLDLESWIPARDEAYLGVLVDDLVTRGVDEPYRLFTSRAEFRLILRQDNCLQRLGPVAERLGLLSGPQLDRLGRHLDDIDGARAWVGGTTVHPEGVNAHLEAISSSPLTEPQGLERLVKRPEVALLDLVRPEGPLGEVEFDDDALTVVEMEMKYSGYIERDRERARVLREREEQLLPENAAYESFDSLSLEARQKLARVRPRTLGQAGRIPGVSPSDLQNLLVELRRRPTSSPA
ncbi:MAG TPA: tRNA uridine-5-carboxymethylaminomethyl(34) synthesis enzyme MnmG [Gemmatimonadota bacterium]|nr:tRNA uridine-5-carboxymethylaminomethyl(34) synthesis enzyme MnmG [Gemmatimonadota bacterium]